MRKLWPSRKMRGAREESHAEVGKILDEQSEKLAEHDRRLRRLELEAGIFKPPLRKHE